MKSIYILTLLSFFLISCGDTTEDVSEANKKTPIRIWKTIDSGYEHIEYEKTDTN